MGRFIFEEIDESDIADYLKGVEEKVSPEEIDESDIANSLKGIEENLPPVSNCADNPVCLGQIFKDNDTNWKVIKVSRKCVKVEQVDANFNSFNGPVLSKKKLFFNPLRILISKNVYAIAL